MSIESQSSGQERAPLITVSNLSVSFGCTVAVQDVSFTLSPGRALALVGESGSGKSVTARSLLGLSGGTVTADTLQVCGRDGLALRDRQWQGIRGNAVSMILQDALMALDPLRPVGREIGDALKVHGSYSRAERRARVIDALKRVHLPDPELRARQRSTELSGGMRQRALIAQALIGDPQVVIADEATTALDSKLTALVLQQLRQLKEQGRAVLMISHDLAQVANLADEIAVMRRGKIVEHGPAAGVLEDPQHEYTRTLLRAVPSGVPRFVPLSASPAPAAPTAVAADAADSAPALRAQNLSMSFGGRRAVDSVSFELPSGTTLGLVGESGSGKTTTARIVLGLQKPDSGQVQLLGQEFAPRKESQRRELRRAMGAIYQNPLGSFDPRYTAGQLLADALSKGKSKRAAGGYRDEVAQLLEQVELDPALASRNPRELSGGQRQRLAIARALAPQPAVLVLDEPVSALDVSIQATVLDLLDRIQQETGTSYLFISHDLSVIEHMSDRVAVMTRGRIVEQADTAQIFGDPQHEYTKSLLSAMPRLR
ncbi:dipeptide ABC transporter ATP-binding protein [Glutamicibacter protophormiae]|uniref:Peptide/nickel transport system ATP-binding protein n=1 Tax=Glutamicibacter protophormiae TaxID=37930 RepID=A0ABS4XLH1_GLUPR|nr:ABC transporter ATP-binding protein [Glutamicibacter protophormiae]MBP2397352.1 peptide/nickel transport system ATP-binding protein [Glutamicibacter protophormiae]GGL79914.1 ABC transporter ATP-binding protein [Glutamicibacter protophormiae]